MLPTSLLLLRRLLRLVLAWSLLPTRLLGGLLLLLPLFLGALLFLASLLFLSALLCLASLLLLCPLLRLRLLLSLLVPVITVLVLAVSFFVILILSSRGAARECSETQGDREHASNFETSFGSLRHCPSDLLAACSFLARAGRAMHSWSFFTSQRDTGESLQDGRGIRWSLWS